MKIRAVLFDFDGTLADTLPLSFRAFQAVFEKYDGRKVTDEQLVEMFGPTEDEIIARNLKAKEAVPQAIEDYYDLYERDHPENLKHNDEINGLLLSLRVRGLKTGIITGIITGKSRRGLDISSGHLKMLQFFDLSISGDEVDKPKPDPEGILRAMEELGVTREETVFLGDSNADILAGKAAGVHTYGVHWLPTFQNAHFEEEPDQIFSRVDELVELLDQAE